MRKVSPFALDIMIWVLGFVLLFLGLHTLANASVVHARPDVADREAVNRFKASSFASPKRPQCQSAVTQGPL